MHHWYVVMRCTSNCPLMCVFICSLPWPNDDDDDADLIASGPVGFGEGGREGTDELEEHKMEEGPYIQHTQMKFWYSLNIWVGGYEYWTGEWVSARLGRQIVLICQALNASDSPWNGMGREEKARSLISGWNGGWGDDGLRRDRNAKACKLRHGTNSRTGMISGTKDCMLWPPNTKTQAYPDRDKNAYFRGRRSWIAKAGATLRSPLSNWEFSTRADPTCHLNKASPSSSTAYLQWTTTSLSFLSPTPPFIPKIPPSFTLLFLHVKQKGGFLAYIKV